MFDITKKRALETAQIELVNGDGSPMYDEAGNELSVTVHGPGSKLWQQADAERSRKRTARIQKNRNITAALDQGREDEIDFLCAITVSFNGWEYPGEFKTSGDMHRAAYSDDTIGFIRDHVHREANDWSVFTRGSAKS
jgi:hypothetical protein